VDDISLQGSPVQAESVLLRAENFWLYHLEGVASYQYSGEFGASSSDEHAAGADGFYNSSGEFVYGTVLRQGLVWANPEPTAVILEQTQSATGLAWVLDSSLCGACVYVSDGPGQSLRAYLEIDGSTPVAELSLPSTDPQGLAAAASGKLYVADAQGRRLLRVSADLDQIEAVAALPAAIADRVPTGLAFDEQGLLHVCFRDSNHLSVLSLNDSD
jgi:hypothetical protein